MSEKISLDSSVLIYLFISMVPSVMTFIMYYVPKQISSVHGVISGQK